MGVDREARAGRAIITASKKSRVVLSYGTCRLDVIQRIWVDLKKLNRV